MRRNKHGEVEPESFEELNRLYSEEMRSIKNAPSTGPGDAMLRSMTMNETRRWFDRQYSRLVKEKHS
jgi:hypothetical protein